MIKEIIESVKKIEYTKPVNREGRAYTLTEYFDDKKLQEGIVKVLKKYIPKDLNVNINFSVEEINGSAYLSCEVEYELLTLMSINFRTSILHRDDENHYASNIFSIEISNINMYSRYGKDPYGKYYYTETLFTLEYYRNKEIKAPTLSKYLKLFSNALSNFFKHFGFDSPDEYFMTILNDKLAEKISKISGEIFEVKLNGAPVKMRITGASNIPTFGVDCNIQVDSFKAIDTIFKSFELL